METSGRTGAHTCARSDRRNRIKRRTVRPGDRFPPEADGPLWGGRPSWNGPITHRNRHGTPAPTGADAAAYPPARELSVQVSALAPAHETA